MTNPTPDIRPNIGQNINPNIDPDSDRNIVSSADALEVLKAADAALVQTETVLKRMSELAAISASGDTTDEERARHQREMKYLIGELDFIANNTEVDGVKPLNGSMPPFSVKTDNAENSYTSTSNN